MPLLDVLAADAPLPSSAIVNAIAIAPSGRPAVLILRRQTPAVAEDRLSIYTDTWEEARTAYAAGHLATCADLHIFTCNLTTTMRTYDLADVHVDRAYLEGATLNLALLGDYVAFMPPERGRGRAKEVSVIEWRLDRARVRFADGREEEVPTRLVALVGADNQWWLSHVRRRLAWNDYFSLRDLALRIRYPEAFVPPWRR
jgi:hypothetical protein